MGSGGSATAIIGNSVGDTGGDETEALTDELQLPSHNHTASSTATNISRQTATAGGAPLNAITVGTTLNPKSTTPIDITVVTTIGDTGASDPFNIIQPAAIVLKLIKT
jgi:microcystin-dependent protein